MARSKLRTIAIVGETFVNVLAGSIMALSARHTLLIACCTIRTIAKVHIHPIVGALENHGWEIANRCKDTCSRWSMHNAIVKLSIEKVMLIIVLTRSCVVAHQVMRASLNEHGRREIHRLPSRG